ncbi:hypothetical protein AAG906_024613 [Vitis piasezkii]
MMGNGNTWVEEAKMHYTLKFNPRVIQDLEDEDDLDNVVSIVMTLQIDPPITFPSSNASCDPNPNTMMLSRGFASRAADTEYIPLESIRFREAILGSGHTFKNAEEFRNAIYQMSLGGRFEYKYKKNSPTHMSVKCSVDGCPWKITAHAVEGNVILRVHTYQVNHNHIAQDECSSKVKVSSKRGAVVVEDVFRTTPDYLPRQIWFIMGCRLVLAIDSCHLSGPYKGALLSAIAYDADDGMKTFLASSISKTFEERKEKKMLCYFWTAFEKLVRFNENLAKWVMENNPEHWAMSKFLKKLRIK